MMQTLKKKTIKQEPICEECSRENCTKEDVKRCVLLEEIVKRASETSAQIY